MCQTPTSPHLPVVNPLTVHSPRRQHLLNLLEQYSSQDLPRHSRSKNNPFMTPFMRPDGVEQQSSDRATSPAHQPPPPYNPLWANRAFGPLDQGRPIGSPCDRPEKDEQSFQRKDEKLPDDHRSSTP